MAFMGDGAETGMTLLFVMYNKMLHLLVKDATVNIALQLCIFYTLILKIDPHKVIRGKTVENYSLDRSCDVTIQHGRVRQTSIHILSSPAAKGRPEHYFYISQE